MDHWLNEISPYSVVKLGVKSAQKRVIFSSLYLGTGKREVELVWSSLLQLIHKNCMIVYMHMYMCVVVCNPLD